MKKIIVLAFMLYACLNINAKIVYLDNTQEKNATENLFNTFSDAYTACTTPGDTIYVLGSVNNYGTITIKKTIVLIGPGYFLTQNTQTQAKKLTANFTRINLNSGSNGTILKGLRLNKNGNYDRIYINSDIDNITIENCYISRIFIDDANGTIYDNIQLKKNYFWYGGIGTGTGNYDYGILTNLIVSNNIFNGGLLLSNGSDGIISNNLFMSNTLNLGVNSNFQIHNNILLAENTSSITLKPLPDISVSHNISIIDIFGTDNNNQSLVNENYLFVGSEGNSSDGQYKLAESSPAIGAGQNGGDIGPFGGADPYRLSGLPNLPNIYELSTGGFVSGDEMQIHLKIKQ